MIRLFLTAGMIATALWLVAVLLGFAIGVWASFFADPAIMAPGSLNRDSPRGAKLLFLGLQVFFVATGIGMLAILRRLRSRHGETC